MTSFTSTRTYIARRLYSIIVEIAAYITLMFGGLLALLDSRDLKETVEWRKKLEESRRKGLPMLREDWTKRKLPFPNSFEKVDAELVKTVACEDALRKKRKVEIALVLIVGTVLLILSKLSALGIHVFGD